MELGKRIAFDYGSVRIGIAVSDPSGIIATPLPYLTNDENLNGAISKLISEINPIYVVVGIPKHLSGKSGTSESQALSFANTLKVNFNLKVYGIDERLSTVSAAGKLRESGKDAKSAKNLIDSAAAVDILELALQMETNSGLSKCEL